MACNVRVVFVESLLLLVESDSAYEADLDLVS